MEKIKNIANKFALKGEIISVEPYGSGHVNKTYLVETTMGKYVLQKINTVAFKHPEQLMENLLKVATVLSKANKETMHFLPTKDGEIYYHDQDVYRLYEFIDNVVVFQEIPNQQVFEQAGSAFGEFINGLKDFNALELHETIKDFHNTPKRFENFKIAVEKDPVNRAKTCQQEIEFILQFSLFKYFNLILDEVVLGKALTSANGATYSIHSSVAGYVKISYVCLTQITGSSSPFISLSPSAIKIASPSLKKRLSQSLISAMVWRAGMLSRSSFLILYKPSPA